MSVKSIVGPPTYSRSGSQVLTATFLLLLALIALGLLLSSGAGLGLPRSEAQETGAAALGARLQVRPGAPVPAADHAVLLPLVQKQRRFDAPAILEFSATPAIVDPGESTMLRWAVANPVAQLTLDPGNHDVTGRSAFTVSPAGTTTYVLTARSDTGSSVAYATVSVRPAIARFYAEQDTIFLGEAVRLRWVVEGAERLDLEPDAGEVTGLNNTVVQPLQTTTYKLTARSGAAQSQAEVQVTVLQPPAITSFAADLSPINLGQATTLRWSIDHGAHSLVLEPGPGDVTGQTSSVVAPTETTPYTLTARNSVGQSQAVTTVVVRQPPAITHFAATPDVVDSGATATLNWTLVHEVDSLVLTPGDLDVTGQASAVVAPVSTTEYTLTAGNAAGSATAQTTVRVRQPPVISSLTAMPSTINAGQSAILRWEVSNEVQRLVLSPGSLDVTGQASTTVTPSVTTLYSLTAENEDGQGTAQVTVTVKHPPIISSFVADPSLIDPGEGATLRWTVANPVQQLMLNPGNHNVTGQSAFTVWPAGTTLYTLTASNSDGSSSAQVTVELNTTGLPLNLLVFDWNKPVTVADRGFAWDYPPMPSANGNWTTPINYAEGTLYFRAEIRSQPVPQDMRLHFCFWQDGTTIENCGSIRPVSGVSGTVVTWSTRVQDMHMKNYVPIDWSRPRNRNGVAIKNRDGLPVSDYKGWNWNGEDPEAWYPLDMRFITVVVAKGAAFDGWEAFLTP
jgi:hypothetical protein